MDLVTVDVAFLVPNSIATVDTNRTWGSTVEKPIKISNISPSSQSRGKKMNKQTLKQLKRETRP